MQKSIIILSLILALTSCNNDIKKNEDIKIENKKIENKLENKESKKIEEKVDKNQRISNGNTYVGFVSTSCPHCIKEMPILDNFSKENPKAKILMVVVNNKKFEGYTISQKKQSEIEEMSYTKLTGDKCGYVPSFVIYDKDKKVVEKKCGGALSKEGLEKALLKEKEIKKEEPIKKEKIKKEKISTGTVEKNKDEFKKEENKKVEETTKKEEIKKEIPKKEEAKILDNKINKNMEAKKGSKVKVHYIGKTKDDGKEFDNSYKRGDTLPFTVGAGQMIKGFDAGVVGMKVGDKKTIEISPKDGYGEYNPNAKQVIPKEKLADFEKNGIKLEVGSELPTQMGKFKIVAVDDKNVTIDTNHALAGKTLIFEVEMVEVK